MDDVRALLDRNLIGTMLLCRAVVPGMLARRAGSVVNIASAAAHFGVSPEVVYSTIKAAIVHYTRCLAVETREHNVRVNCVSPGATRRRGSRAHDRSIRELVDRGRHAHPLRNAARPGQRRRVSLLAGCEVHPWAGAARGRGDHVVSRLKICQSWVPGP